MLCKKRQFEVFFGILCTLIYIQVWIFMSSILACLSTFHIWIIYLYHSISAFMKALCVFLHYYIDWICLFLLHFCVSTQPQHPKADKPPSPFQFPFRFPPPFFPTRPREERRLRNCAPELMCDIYFRRSFAAGTQRWHAVACAEQSGVPDFAGGIRCHVQKPKE